MPPQQLDVTRAATLAGQDVLSEVHVAHDGLSTAEVRARQAALGPNAVRSHHARALVILGRQLRSPLLLLLLVTASVSYFVGEGTDAVIIGTIVALSIGLGFVNEFRAARAVEALHSEVRHRAVVHRDCEWTTCDVIDLVPGDLVRIDTGAIVPADIRLLRTDALECDESVLTGESLPVEKSSAPVTAGTGLNDLTCCALMGTLVRAGEGEGVVVGTGGSTEFGRIALSLGAVAISAIAVVVVGAILPMSPLADDLGFARLPAGFFAALVGMVIAYLTLAEVAKREFYQRLERPRRVPGRREQRRIQRRAARFSRRGALSR